MRKHKFIVQLALATLSLLCAGSDSARAEDKPSEIRIAYPGVGIGNRPFAGGNSTAVLHLKGLLDEEFKKDGIKVTWTFLRGAGPAVNELYANGLVDFSLLGDLPSIVGRASGLETRVLAATGIRGNTYLVVPADSSISSIKDLKGKRVAIFKGTNIQLSVAKILEANGLSEKDIRAINMDNATSRAAVTTKDVDAVFGGFNLLSLRDQGVAKVVYTTQGDPRFLRHASFVGSEKFIKKYPQITQRIVNQLVVGAKWMSDRDNSRNEVFNLFTKNGFRFNDYKEDATGQSLKVWASPLIDPYFVSEYTKQINDAKRFGLIKNSFSLESWLDTRFLDKALKDQGLTAYWQPVDKSGNVSAAKSTPANADTRSAAVAQPSAAKVQ